VSIGLPVCNGGILLAASEFLAELSRSAAMSRLTALLDRPAA
jgi:hypothetical protein